MRDILRSISDAVFCVKKKARVNWLRCITVGRRTRGFDFGALAFSSPFSRDFGLESLSFSLLAAACVGMTVTLAEFSNPRKCVPRSPLLRLQRSFNFVDRFRRKI